MDTNQCTLEWTDENDENNEILLPRNTNHWI